MHVRTHMVNKRHEPCIHMKIMQNTKYVHHTIIPKQFKCRDCGCSTAVLLFLVQVPADKSGLHVACCCSPSLHRVKFSKYFRGQLLQSCLQLHLQASTPCGSIREQKFNNLGGSHAADTPANRRTLQATGSIQRGRGSGAALTSAYAQTQRALRMYWPKFKVICLCLCRFVFS